MGSGAMVSKCSLPLPLASQLLRGCVTQLEAQSHLSENLEKVVVAFHSLFLGVLAVSPRLTVQVLRQALKDVWAAPPESRNVAAQQLVQAFTFAKNKAKSFKTGSKLHPVLKQVVVAIQKHRQLSHSTALQLPSVGVAKPSKRD